MNNHFYLSVKTKSEEWFSEMYNSKTKSLHEKLPYGSVLNYIHPFNFHLKKDYNLKVKILKKIV